MSGGVFKCVNPVSGPHTKVPTTSDGGDVPSRFCISVIRAVEVADLYGVIYCLAVAPIHEPQLALEFMPAKLGLSNSWDASDGAVKETAVVGPGASTAKSVMITARRSAYTQDARRRGFS